MDSARQLPDRERLSTVMVVILLAYAVAHFVQLPGRTLALELAGVYLPLQFNINTIVAVLVAGLTASGADWLLREHPALGVQSTYRHWLLPAMTAWVLTLPLSNLPFSPQWWAAFAGGGLLLTSVFVAEYASISEDGRYRQFASLALTALAYGLFLILAISVRGVALRLYLALPAIALGVFLISARVHLLRSTQEWQPLQSFGITFITIQLAAALHYLPISALGYGLMLLGVVYALNVFALALNAGDPPREAAREPLVALAAFWVLALLIR
jgi:hypothetical protein